MTKLSGCYQRKREGISNLSQISIFSVFCMSLLGAQGRQGIGRQLPALPATQCSARSFPGTIVFVSSSFLGPLATLSKFKFERIWSPETGHSCEGSVGQAVDTPSIPSHWLIAKSSFLWEKSTPSVKIKFLTCSRTRRGIWPR